MGGQGLRQKEGTAIRLMFWLSVCCFVAFLLFCFLATGRKPLASPCAVCEKVGFEVSHAVSTVVEVRAELAECKGLPDGAVGFSLQWFCLAREMPSRTRDMNWMLESYCGISVGQMYGEGVKTRLDCGQP